jgi:hypothetical protein
MEDEVYRIADIDFNGGVRAGRKAMLDDIRDLLVEVSEFLDNYTDAEYIEGTPVGNHAMNLKCSVDELIGVSK